MCHLEISCSFPLHLFLIIWLPIHLSGVARGCGWQHIGAYVNLGAFYLAGIPVASVLGFVLHLRGKGLWIGILTGSALQSALLCLITGLTNWQQQVFLFMLLWFYFIRSCLQSLVIHKSQCLYKMSDNKVLFTNACIYVCVCAHTINDPFRCLLSSG